MKPRLIRGLIWARSCERPQGMPVGRPRGKKAAGVRYERELARAIPGALHGQWFQFQDAGGPGHCQTDLLLETALGWVVLEAKYTWTEQGHRQVEGLYRPVIERAWRAPVFGLVVCRVLTPEVQRDWVCRDLVEALSRAQAGKKTVLHWLGGVALPLGPRATSSPRSHLAQGLAEL